MASEDEGVQTGFCDKHAHSLNGRVMGGLLHLERRLLHNRQDTRHEYLKICQQVDCTLPRQEGGCCPLRVQPPLASDESAKSPKRTSWNRQTNCCASQPTQHCPHLMLAPDPVVPTGKRGCSQPTHDITHTSSQAPNLGTFAANQTFAPLHCLPVTGEAEHVDKSR